VTLPNVAARFMLGGLMALTTTATVVPPASDAEAQPCDFRLGFKTLREQIPDLVGDCRAEEQFDPVAERTEQLTTGGLLVWDKQTNVTSFTDGEKNWLQGPRGLESRPNEGRLLSWESTFTPTLGPGLAELLSPGPMPSASDATPAVPLINPTGPELTEVLPRPTGANGSEASFILTAAAAARVSQRETGVPASVTIAQAILESSWGKSRLSKDNNNYFGIKARDGADPSQVAWYDTWEVVDGENISVQAPFRAYQNAADSFVDHGRFFIRNSRYRPALAVKDDPQQFAAEISRAGYATDPDYAPKLIRLMDRFNLYAYDLA
jgi:hypothetical protein